MTDAVVVPPATRSARWTKIDPPPGSKGVGLVRLADGSQLLWGPTPARFDPATSTWTALPSANATCRPGTQPVRVGDRIVGVDDDCAFDVSTGAWSRRAHVPIDALPTIHGEYAYAPLGDGDALLVGGGDWVGSMMGGSWTTTTSAGVYESKKDRCAKIVLPEPVIFPRIVTLKDGRVLVVEAKDAPSPVWIYSPATRSWKKGVAVLAGGEPSLLADGRVLFVSTDGANAGTYDPVADVFAPSSPAPMKGDGFVVVPLSEGRVLVAGGRDARGKLLARAEIYDPKANRWAATADMKVACAGFGAALESNRALVVGFTDDGAVIAQVWSEGASGIP